MCESIEGIENNFCANRNISAELLFRSLFLRSTTVPMGFVFLVV